MDSERIKQVKMMQRPGKLDQWRLMNLSDSNYFDTLWGLEDKIERRESERLSIEEFRMSYESANRPLVITGAVNDWKAFRKLSFSVRYLYRKFGDKEFKCGQTNEGDFTYIEMKEFIEYVFDQKDDFPLYIFDDGFKKNCPKILKLYNVPKYFPDDLFQEVKNRPPYSWILVGPKRSGTQMHQDPLGTSAWNVSIVGYKLWALFPPSLPRHIAKGLHLSSTKTPSKVPKAEPFTFFNSTLSLIQKKFQLSALTFIQKPGELVFIPSKWWHIVLNLTDTIAITHNFTSRCNFDAVWRMTRKQRKKFFIRWQEKLSKSNPDLLERGKKLDLIDNYG